MLHLYAAPMGQADQKYPGSRRFESLSVECGQEGEAGTEVPQPRDENSIPYEAEPAPYKVAGGAPE